jgi:putative periplasmic protein
MKYFLLLIVTTLTFSAASAQNKKITFNDLPSEAINYIDNRSLANDITSVWKNTNDNIYTVIFNDGTEIEFNNNGEWKEAKINNEKFSVFLVPEKVLGYIQANYPLVSVRKVSRNLDKKGYKTELSNKKELNFDENFNFVKAR